MLSSDCVPKTLLIGPSFIRGGGEKHFYALSKHLFKGKADICLLLNDNLSGLDISNLNISYLGWKNKYSYPMIVMKLRKIIQKGRYDVVMGFGLYPNILGWLATCFCKKQPMLISTEISRPYLAFSTQRKGLKKGFIKILQQSAYQSADLFIANSADGVTESVRHFNVRKNIAKRIPNLINEQEVRNDATQLLSMPDIPHKHKITVVSRLVNMKRVDTVIDAMALLPKYIDCALMIAGDGPELPNLKRQAKDLGIADRVFFLGWMKNPLPLVRQSSVFVISSEYEGFSNSVLEAMFLDVPVITSFCSTDARQMCEQGAAMGFQPKDARALSEQIVSLLSSEQKRQKIIETSLEYRRCHECSQAILYYEQIILEAVKSRNKRC